MKQTHRFFLFICFLFPVFSCSFTEKIATDDYDISKIESKFKDKEVTILLITGGQIKAKTLEISTDSIGWRASVNSSVTKFSSKEVRSITYTDRMLGSLIGTVIGFSAGVLVSKMNGKAHAKSKCNGDCDQEVPVVDDALNDLGDDFAEGTEQMLFGSLGGIIGYLVGRDAFTHGVVYTGHLDPSVQKVIELPLSAILKEDTESIKIDYLNKKCWLQKSQIDIQRKKDTIVIRLSAGLFYKTFGE